MAHFALLWKARTIEKQRQRYENEKINSIFMSRPDMPDKTLSQKWRHYKQDMHKRLSRTFSKWYPEGSTVSNFFVSLRSDMKLPSILLRSLYGFIGGLVLTYLAFMFFVFQLSLSEMHATVLSSILGVLLTLGLTFSNRTRCIIFLLVPQLFSRVGRYTLTCYALVLILTGPATNTLRNLEVLSESMACSQERIKLSVRQINDSIKKPYNSIKNSLKITVESMNLVVRRLKTALININRLILSIASIIQSGLMWIAYTAEVCNDALGSPEDKCLKIMTEKPIKWTDNYDSSHAERKHVKKSSKNCLRDLLESLGIKNIKKPRDDNFDFGPFKKLRPQPYFNEIYKSLDNTERSAKKDNEISKSEIIDSAAKEYTKFPWFSNTDKLSKMICASLKSYTKFFVPADFTEKTFLATIRKKLKTFVSRIRSLIQMQINIQHTYSIIGNSSYYNQITAGVITEIRNRADPILTWLSWSSCVTSLFLLLIIFRAKHYQRMFETRSRFDNRFITKEFRELDLKRLREGRETTLPLNTRERAKYVTTTSFRLVASEKTHLNRSAVFMTVTTFKLLVHIVADYSLYWVLITIRYHGKLQSPMQPGTTDTGSLITGNGFVTRLLQAFIDSMHMELLFSPPDISCLPNPYPPDIKRYCQIGFLIILLWFFALFEPYGLRMRHLIMGHYRPQRAKDRAVWLYNHVLRTRASFMKYARRKLHRRFKYSLQSQFTFQRWLQTHFLLCWLRSLLGIKLCNELYCLLCNAPEDENDINTKLIQCEVLNCPGSYCPSCFSDIGQLCTICLSPSDYGDFSDASLEKGSSDENDSDSDYSGNYDDYGRDNNNPTSGYGRYSDDANDEEDTTFSRFSEYRQTISFLEIKKEKDDSTPLLQHSLMRNTKNYIKDDVRSKLNEIKYVEGNNICMYLHIKAIRHITMKISGIYDDTISELDMNTLKKTKSLRLFQYSVYEITNNPLGITKSDHTTNISKYLRKNKFIRRKKPSTKEYKCLMSFSRNNMRDITKKSAYNRNYANKANNLNEFKKVAKNNIGNESNDLNITEAAYYLHFKPSTSKFKNHNAVNRKSHTTFSKYLRTLKCAFLSRKRVNDTQDESPIKHVKFNRKKKRKKTTNITRSKALKLNKEENNAGKSRIFAYLDERDWIHSYVLDNDVHTAIGDIDMKTGKSIIVNNIMIPRLNLNLSSDSLVEPRNNVYQNAGTSQVVAVKSKPFAINAIRRFLRLIICSSSESFASCRHVDRVCNTHDIFRFNKASKSKAKEGIAQENKGISAQSNNFIACSESIQSASFIIPDSSEEDLRGFHMKRLLSNPLSIIRNVYSSLFLSNNKNKLEKHDKINQNPIDMKEILMNVHEYKEDEQENITLSKAEKEKLEKNMKVLREKKNKKSTRAAIPTKEQKKEQHKKEADKHDDKEIQTVMILNWHKTDDKAVTAYPTMVSCGCQNVGRRHNTQDFGIQVTARSQGRKMANQGNDAASMTNNLTCTCAAQCHKNSKDVGTLFSERFKDVKTLPLHPAIKSKEKTVDTPDTSSSTTDSSSPSDDTKTDTTICSLASMDYRTKTIRDQKIIEPRRRFKVRVVTKSNQSTLTDRANYCDVSTATYDWWSPIVERKNIVQRTNREFYVEKKKKEYDMQKIREKKTFRSKGVSAGEKVVKFRSKTQFIPRQNYGFGDIMSPSRYLLESQKYYNELFYNIFTSPRVYPVANLQQILSHENRDQAESNSHIRRRGRKTKRLEESYSPRKNIQPNLWKRKVGQARSSEMPRKNKRI